MIRAAAALTIVAALLAGDAAAEDGPWAGAATQDGSALRLDDGFEDGAFAGGGGLYYKMNREQSAGTATFQSDVVRSGRSALELTVHPMCKVQSSTSCSERAEVWERPDVLALYATPIWYALSMKLDRPVPTEVHRYVMAQWKREIDPGAIGDYSPLLALRLIEGRLSVTVETDTGSYQRRGSGPRAAGCLPGEIAASEPDNYDQFRALVASEPGGVTPVEAGFVGCSPDIRVTPREGQLPAAGSGWIDFVFMVKPGPSGDGRIEVAANGAWVATVEGHIGHEGEGLGAHKYFKFGPYRAGAADMWRIYYDDFRRGPSCSDVAPPQLCGAIEGVQVVTP